MEQEEIDSGQGVRLDLSPKERQALYLVRRSRRARHRQWARNSPTGSVPSLREPPSPEKDSKVRGESRGKASAGTTGGESWGREGPPLQARILQREVAPDALWGGASNYTQAGLSYRGHGERETDERLRADENAWHISAGHDTFSDSLCSPATLLKLQDNSRSKGGGESGQTPLKGVVVKASSSQEGRQGGANEQDKRAWKQETESERWGRVERGAGENRAGQYEDSQHDLRRMASAQGQENGAILRDHEDLSPEISPNNVLHWEATRSSYVQWHPSDQSLWRGEDSGGRNPGAYVGQATRDEGMPLRGHDATCQNDSHSFPSRENAHVYEGSIYPPPIPHPRQTGEAQFPNPRRASPKRAHSFQQPLQEVLGQSRLGRDPSADPNGRVSERGMIACSVVGGWQGTSINPPFRSSPSSKQILPPRFSQPPSPSCNPDPRRGANTGSSRHPPSAAHGSPRNLAAGAYEPPMSNGFRRESEDRTECTCQSPNPLSRTYTAHCLWEPPPEMVANLAATFPPNSAPLSPFESRLSTRFVRPRHRFPDLMPLGGLGFQLQEPPLTNASVRQAADDDVTLGGDREWPGRAETDAPRGERPVLYPLYNQREAPIHSAAEDSPQGRGVKTFSPASESRAGPSLIGVLRAYYGTRSENPSPEGVRKLAATYPGVLPRDLKSAPNGPPEATIHSPRAERRASIPGSLSCSGGASSHIALRPPSTPRLHPSPRARGLLRSSTAGDSQNEGATRQSSGGADGTENRGSEALSRFHEKGEESKAPSGGGPRKERDRERFQRADAENGRERSAPEGANPQPTPGTGTTPDLSCSGAEECSPALERLVYSWLDGIASRLSDVESDRAVTSSEASDALARLRGPVRNGTVGGVLPGGSAPGKTGPQENAGGVKQQLGQDFQPGTSHRSRRLSLPSARSSGIERKGNGGSNPDLQSAARGHGSPHADADPRPEATAVPQSNGQTRAETQRNDRKSTTTVPSVSATSSDRVRYKAEIQRDHATLQDWVTFAHDQERFLALQAQGNGAGDGGNERGEKKHSPSRGANGHIPGTAEFEFLKPCRETSPLSRSHSGSNCSTPALGKAPQSEANRPPGGLSEEETSIPSQNGRFRSGRWHRNQKPERHVVSNNEQAKSPESPQSADAEGREGEQRERSRGFPERLLTMQRCQICREEIQERDAVYAPPRCWHFCHFECVGNLLLDKPMSCAYCT